MRVHMQIIEDILVSRVDNNDVREGEVRGWNGKFHGEVLTI